jgi:hypothetical protein
VAPSFDEGKSTPTVPPPPAPAGTIANLMLTGEPATSVAVIGPPTHVACAPPSPTWSHGTA